MMNKALLSLTFGVVFACCTPMTMPTPLGNVNVENDMYKILKEEDVDFSMMPLFTPVSGDLSKYLFFMDKKIIFRAAAIEYETVLPDNKTKVKASGILYHPINKKSRGVVEFIPTAHLEAGSAGSELLYTIQGIQAFEGYTVIMPDLIGCGSSDRYPMPFFMVESTGRVSYDMRCAAANYLWDKFEYKLPAETMIMGYSLGGSGALATQKYYETHHAQTIKVKEVFASGGVYDLPAAFAAFAKTGISDYVAIPSTIYALNYYYKIGLDFDKIFIGKLRTHMDTWLVGPDRLKAENLLNELGREMKNYMHPDFFKSMEDQKGTEFEKLHSAMIENSVSRGWLPIAPIFMTHGYEDTCVPIENAKAAVKSLRSAGATISFFAYPGTHNTIGYTFFIQLMLRFL